MISVQERVSEETSNLNFSGRQYEVGERVIWCALCNAPQHYMPGEKIRGTILDVFDNGGKPTYRIVLDIVWNQTAIGEPIGRAIVVGNVRGGSIHPIVE